MITIQQVPETGSTNADLATRLRAGERLSEGHWLVADRQTAGRGRQGREWFDGTGNFMGSTIVRPAGGDPAASSLPFMAGLAVYETVLALFPVPGTLQLKWPNDLMLKGAKLAGILLEAQGDAVIVGIGVNLTVAPSLPDRATIALADCGPAPDRDAFAQSLATSFAAEIERWRRYGVAALLTRWQAAAHDEGTTMTVHAPGGETVRGNYAGLAADGALQLRLADGSLRAIHAGEINLTNGN